MKPLSKDYDLVIIGGGIAGSTLANVMSSRGASTLVIEKERKFKDRVRGDGMTSWGAELASDLGIYELVLGDCAHELPILDIFVAGMQISNRNLIETTPCIGNLTALSRGDERRVRRNGRLLKDRSAVAGGCLARHCASPLP